MHSSRLAIARWVASAIAVLLSFMPLSLGSAAGENVVTEPGGKKEFAYTNRLIDSNDPYLLLHAHNPVDWYPWGPWRAMFGCAPPMRISEKPLSRYPWYLRPFFRYQKRKYGQVLKPALLWGRVPKLFMAIASLYGVIDRRGSPLDPVLRSLVTVRVSQLNWCRFCVDINSATLAARAGSMAKVEALDTWRDSDLFDAKEKAALEYAEAMTDSNQRVTDPMVGRLRDFFTDDAIVELTGLIAFQNLSSKFNSALDAPAQGFCRLPSESRAADR